jgi:hypothetical protein
VATREGATGPAAAVEAVHPWNERKRVFSERQIRLARDVLAGDASARHLRLNLEFPR